MSGRAPIAALATVVGASETALVRISGAGCHALVGQIFSAEEDSEAGRSKGATIERGSLSLETAADLSRGARNSSSLPALSVRYPEGRSYTGEESVELVIPGAPIWPRALLARLEALGVEPAGPGEFTRRAFENGRIDLTRAESVATLIAAENLEAARAARRTLEGVLAEAVHSVADRLHDTIALLEAGLDFADQEIDPPSPATILDALAPIERELEAWLERPDAGGAVGENARCLLWGRANAGKSSLLNAFAGEEVALVSEVAGTTTDAVSGRLRLAHGTVELLDLPGRKDALSAIELRADDLARQSIAEADPIAYLFDAARPFDEIMAEWRALPAEIRDRATPVLQKIDQCSEPIRAERGEEWPEAIQCSARTGEGLDRVRAHFDRLLATGAFAARGSSLYFNDRQRRRVAECRETLAILGEDLRGAGRTEPELVVVDLRRAHGSLEEITGEIVTEETLTRIFSRFCVGK